MNKRYVDAGRLMKVLEEDIPITDNPVEVMASAIAALEAQPTADVRENIKGCWVPHPDKSVREFDVCTACGIGCKRREYGKNDDGTEWMTEYSFPYCPNCGAQMIRGEA